ncbi:MAG: serine/threonine-protein kinase, partial [Myxococcota bacterium]
GFARLVAIKKIKPEFRALQNYIDMFKEEARVGSDLAHPNIVQIYDFFNDDDYYLIMEWVEGVDLGTFVRTFRRAKIPVPWQFVAAVAIGGLRGLGAAHERRRDDGSVAPVIHRDVSPQNILLNINGVVKITDFGLARARDRIQSLTAPGTVKGKLSYLAPEVTFGKTATPLSDLFSMANVMWEALAGKKLFKGATDLDVFKKIRKCEIPSLRFLRPDIPPEMADIIHRALAREPGDRYASARIMANALGAVLIHARWREDAYTDLGEMVNRIRNGREIRVDHLSGGPVGSPSATARPSVLAGEELKVRFSQPLAGARTAKAGPSGDLSESVDIEFTEEHAVPGKPHSDS